MPDNTQDHDQEQDQHFDAATRVRGRRNRFYRSKVMTASAYQTEQDYFIQRRRLLTRSVMGWGIAFGLLLETGQDGASPATWSVGRGLALDKKGREIEVGAQGVTLDRSNVFLAVKTGDKFDAIELDHQDMALGVSDYLLSIHYAERHAVDARVDDGCGCHRHEHQFIDETVMFSLRAVSSDTRCGEDPCPKEGKYERDAREGRDRGPHRQLVEWSRHTSVADETKLGNEWGRYFVDLDAGVPLAIVTAKRHGNRCEALTLTPKDDHSPRRVLKRNDMLYDLIRGCDLTRIKEISWSRYHRQRCSAPIPYEDFRNLMAIPEATAQAPMGNEANQWAAERAAGDSAFDECVVINGAQRLPIVDNDPLINIASTGLWITFTGPVDRSTLMPDCFSLNFIVIGADTGWRDVRHLPVVALHLDPPSAGDPQNSTRKATLQVNPRWVREVVGGANIFGSAKFRMEILVHGDYILDCRGQAIDANARGTALSQRDPAPSGNGSPGGTFRSLLWIQKQSSSGGDD